VARPRKKFGRRERTLSFKVTGELDDRLKRAAAVTKLTPSALAVTAVEAVLAAIERDKGIVMPVAFTVARVPAVVYPEFTDSGLGMVAEGEATPEKLVETDAKLRQAADAKRAASQDAARP
jgi:hypothetical protein